MKDLIAIAKVRRLLLNLEHDLAPEQLEALVGPLNHWIAAPAEDLDGRSPMRVLDEPEGEGRLLAYLNRLLHISRQRPGRTG